MKLIVKNCLTVLKVLLICTIPLYDKLYHKVLDFYSFLASTTCEKIISLFHKAKSSKFDSFITLRTELMSVVQHLGYDK